MLFKNESPWLHQLVRTRIAEPLSKDASTDVAIIGGGIAGIATAYFTLRYTHKKVLLVEAGNVAHGATGHNGGFLATYFERSFKSLVQEFGINMAAEGQRDVESAWELLAEIRREAQLKTPLWQFTGYAALPTSEEFLLHLRNNALREKAGLLVPKILVSEEWKGLSNIPGIYKHLYSLVSKTDLLSLIESRDEEYFAALPEQKGCMNSAAFCEELVGFLLARYEGRFTLTEQTPIVRLVLEDGKALLHTDKHLRVTASHVVLCTNGFENIKIVNKTGDNINKKFHYLVRGIVGYMAGYVEESAKPAAEISYLSKSVLHRGDVYAEDPYFYLTRRPYATEGTESSLISIGGPEALMDDTNNYTVDHEFPGEAREQIDNFLRYTYKHGHDDAIEYRFLWHGLMGFTPNGVRLIGFEPLNPVLLYNLGCNGVGLMPSIFGGRRISRLLAGEQLPLSMFDPKDLRRSSKKRVVALRKMRYLSRHGVTLKNKAK